MHTHGSLQAQMAGMIDAWQWNVHDTVLHVLPLHHVHGIVNVLMTPLAVGATCVMLPRFNPEQVRLSEDVLCRYFFKERNIYETVSEHKTLLKSFICLNI